MAAPKKIAVPALPELVYHECAQSSPEWYEARRGLATASTFSAIIANSEDRKGRAKLLRQLAAEQLTEEATTDGFQSAEMQRGKEMEPEIRNWYSRTKFADVREVGFVFNPAVNAGWSPDGLVGDDGALELKWHRPDVMIELLDKPVFPNAHRAQVQGALWVGRRKFIDYIAYSHAKLPKWTCRVEADAGYQKEIADAVEVFNWELAQLVKRLKGIMA